MPFLIGFLIVLGIGWVGISAINRTVSNVRVPKTTYKGPTRAFVDETVATGTTDPVDSSEDLTGDSEGGDDPNLKDLVHFLSANGMFGPVNRPIEKCTWVRDPLIREMVSAYINQRPESLWELHHYRLRVRRSEDSTDTGELLLLTPDHVIPFHWIHDAPQTTQKGK